MNQDTHFKSTERPGEKPFPGFVQFVVLLSLLPVVIDHSIFLFFGELTMESTLYTLDTAGQKLDISDHFVRGRGEGFIALVAYGAALILYPLAVISCIRQRSWTWLFLGLFVLHGVAAVVIYSLLASPAPDLNNDTLPYINAASYVSLLWFIIVGRIFTKSFFLFMFLALFARLFTGQVDSLSSWFSPIFILLILAPIGKILGYALYQNFYLFRFVGVFRTTWLFIKSTCYWAPLLLIIVPILYFNWWWHTFVEDSLYEVTYSISGEVLSPSIDPATGKHHISTVSTQPNLITVASNDNQRRSEVDFPWSIRNVMADYRFIWNQRVAIWEDNITAIKPANLTEQGLAIVAAEFDKSFPPSLDLKPKVYDGFITGDAKTWASRNAVEATQSGYKEVRDRARANLLEKVEQVSRNHIEPQVNSGKQYMMELIANVKPIAEGMFQEVNRDAQIAIIGVLKYLKLSHLVFNILFAFVCFRSFLYIFGRIAFDASNNLFVTLRDTRKGLDEIDKLGRISIHEKEYHLDDKESGTYYFSRKLTPHGCPPRLAIPQPAAAPIARTLHGAMALNKVCITRQKGKVYYSLTKGEHFVEWDLVEGETIAFDYRNFAGMSESVTLSVIISARVSSVLFDKIIYATATGPGKIILITDGMPKAGDNEQTRSSMPVNRIVAWHSDILFNTVSELNVIDVYFSDLYVQKHGPGMLVMDVDKRGAPRNGLGRFIKHFFMP